jgi:predicted nicotinamide N-methyase
VTGLTLTLSWTALPGPVTGDVLEAGSTQGLASIGAATIGAGTSFLITGVPARAYEVRARAITRAGIW